MRFACSVIGCAVSGLALGLSWASADVLAGATAGAAPAAAPVPGRYAAQLCVSLSAAPLRCGAAEVDWQRDGQAHVRVSDISYRLQLTRSQVEVVLLHGTMQIDEFVSPFAWVGSSLKFADAARSTGYELRLGGRKPARP